MKRLGKTLYFLCLIGSMAWFLLCCLMFLIRMPSEDPIPQVGNRDVHRIETSSSIWNVVITADVQDGVMYLPEVFERARDVAPKAILNLGDFAIDHDRRHHAVAAWYMKEYPSPAPFFIVPGNHDIKGTEGVEAFRQWYGALTFDVAIDRTRFLGLNNANGPFDDTQLEILRETLEEGASRGEQFVLLMHRDMLSEMEAPLKAQADKFIDMIQQYPVRYVFSGHSHSSYKKTIGKITFVVAPASGDFSIDVGHIPISFLCLRWNGHAFSLEETRFYRRNGIDLSGMYVHMMIAHVYPLYEEAPVGFLLLMVCSVVLPFAIPFFVRWRKRRRGEV